MNTGRYKVASQNRLNNPTGCCQLLITERFANVINKTRRVHEGG